MSGSPTPPDTRPDDRSVPLLIAAALLVLAVVGAVLLFGVERPPPVEPLAAESPFTPPASIAWTVRNGDEPCLHVGDPRGEVRELLCDERGFEVIAWTDEGILAHRLGVVEGNVVAVDPATGERSEVSFDIDRGPRDGVRPLTDREDGTLVVSIVDDTAERTVVWEVDAPDAYDVDNAAISPDGAAVAMTDTAGRLLVAPTDGSEEPRLWSDEVEPYTQIVWQGTDPTR